MTTYAYQATDSSGKRLDGTIDAHSLQAARESIISLGLEPLEIYEAAASATTLPDAKWVDPILSMEPDEPVLVAEGPEAAYFPLLETLRLYAGWLLAWYSLVYAVGAYQFMKDIPVHVPYAESLFLSPLVLSFTFAAYIFLLFSGIYKATGRSKKVGIVLAFGAVAVFILYKMNLQ